MSFPTGRDYTLWYRANQRPVRVGMYVTRIEGGRQEWTWWDGKEWLVADWKISPGLAVEHITIGRASWFQDREWRGVNKELS